MSGLPSASAVPGFTMTRANDRTMLSRLARVHDTLAPRKGLQIEFNWSQTLLASCPAPEPMRLRPSHVNDAFLTLARIVL